jgi:GGDEF domain-containing protein
MQEDERSRERAERLNQVFESLLKGRQAESAAQQESGESWLEDRIGNLPERAQTQIRSFERKLTESGVQNPAKRAELVEEKIVAFEQTYQDRRFTVKGGEHMLNKAFAKEQAVSYLKEILGDSPTPQDLKKVALLNADANGLKAVNDLSGSHERGTEYLKRVAEVFADDASPEAKRLKELGIDIVLPVTAGGDEYSALLRSDRVITPEVMEEAIRLYDQAIQRVDVSDLVDFTEEATLLRYLGVSEQQFGLMKEEQRQKLLDDGRKEVPKGFKMRASASLGGATLYEGLLMAMEHQSKPLTDEDDFSRAIDKIVGGMWDASDKAAMENKTTFKEGLRAEGSPEGDRFFSKVLARTSEARVLEAKLDAMTMELKKSETMESELAKLDELMDQGVMDEAAYGRNMREIRKKYRTNA